MKKSLVLSFFLAAPVFAQSATPIYYSNPASRTCIEGRNCSPIVDLNGRLVITASTGATQPLKAEDSAAANGDSGSNILGVRIDLPTAQTGTTGDYGAITLDSLGRINTAFAPNGVISRACSTAATGTADTTILNNPGGAIRYYITSIGCSNNSTVPSEITFEEGGSSVLWKAGIPALANGGNLQIDFGATPLRTGANTTFTFVMTTTATSTTCCAKAYQITD